MSDKYYGVGGLDQALPLSARMRQRVKFEGDRYPDGEQWPEAREFANETATLESTLEAAKLREAELREQINQIRLDWYGLYDKLQQERDAALSALKSARDEFKAIEHCAQGSTVHFISTRALAKISDPTAALAERDRAIEKRTAERYKAVLKKRMDGMLQTVEAIESGKRPARDGLSREMRRAITELSDLIEREFNLEPSKNTP